jgi:predicted HTH domain antitoxin
MASSTAGTALWGFLDELKRRNVALKYSAAEAEAEIKRVLERRS